MSGETGGSRLFDGWRENRQFRVSQEYYAIHTLTFYTENLRWSFTRVRLVLRICSLPCEDGGSCCVTVVKNRESIERGATLASSSVIAQTRYGDWVLCFREDPVFGGSILRSLLDG